MLYINCIFIIIIIIKVWCGLLPFLSFFNKKKEKRALQCTLNTYVKVLCAVHSLLLIRKKLNSTFSLFLEQSNVSISFAASPSKRCYKAGGTALELPRAKTAQVRSTLKILLSQKFCATDP